MASGRFVTFCYARIDAAGRRIVYSNAGHNPPLLIRADGAVERLTEGGMVLGVFPDNTYEQAELPLGAAIGWCSTPTASPRRETPPGSGRRRGSPPPPPRTAEPVEAMKDALLADVNAFTGGQFEDDATLIVVGIP